VVKSVEETNPWPAEAVALRFSVIFVVEDAQGGEGCL